MAMWSGSSKARSRRCARTAWAVGMLVAATSTVPGAVSAAPCNGRSFERVSLSSAGAEGDKGSLIPSLSFDGCIVGFKSDATNLLGVGNDSNNATDVFVRDRMTDATSRVSVDVNNHEADELSFPPALSADGNLVAFASQATNLIQGDANGQADVFVKNRSDGSVQRVSVSAIGPEPNDGSPDIAPAISYDGRFVAFASRASNLVKDVPARCANGQNPDNPGNEASDVFVYDRTTGTTELISRAGVGSQRGCAAKGESIAAALSGTGRFVAFVTNAIDLIDGIDPVPENTRHEIYVWDRETQTMERMTVTIDGKPANGESRNPTITDDGRYVAFASDASNLVPGDNNGVSDVFIRDRLAGVTIRVEPPSGCSTGGVAAIDPTAFSDAPSFSGDGHYLAFVSLASNFLAGDTNGVADILVLQLATGLVARVNGAGGVEPNGASGFPHISGDGNWIAFQSDADNLLGAGADSNGATDVFVASNPFVSGQPIPGVTPLPTCSPTPTSTATPSATPTSCVPGGCTGGLVCVLDRCVTPTPSATPTSCVPGGCTGGLVCVLDRCVTPTPTATAPPPAGAAGGGGGGCSCRVDPRASSDDPVLPLAFAPLLILWGLRRVSRRGA